VGHNIHVEKPEILIDPILEMINIIQGREKTSRRTREGLDL